jgi:hypothetical protein
MIHFTNLGETMTTTAMARRTTNNYRTHMRSKQPRDDYRGYRLRVGEEVVAHTLELQCGGDPSDAIAC